MSDLNRMRGRPNVVITGSLDLPIRRPSRDGASRYPRGFLGGVAVPGCRAAGRTFAYWLTIPLHTVLGWRLRGAVVPELLTGEPIRAEHAVVPGIAARLDQRIDDLADPEDRRENALLELQAFLHRVVLASRSALDTGPGQPSHAVSTPAAAMATFIARRFRDPIRVEDVAADAHLHPHYAMEVFRQSTGSTIGGYIAQCRLAEAQRLLITTSLSVAAVAATAGFGSTGRFYAVWNGVDLPRPAAYRRANRDAAGWPGG